MILLRSQCKNEHTRRIRQDFLEKITATLIKECKKKCDDYASNKYMSSDMFCDQISLLYDHKPDNVIYNHLKKLESEISDKCLNTQSLQDESNPYHNAEFAEILLHLLTVFPVWTNIIPSQCEDTRLHMSDLNVRYLSSITDYVLKDAESEQLSIDKFAIQHAEFLKHKLQENRELIHLQRKQHKKAAKAHEENSMHTYLNLQEDWRGKGDQIGDKHDLKDSTINSATLPNDVSVENNDITFSLDTSSLTECSQKMSTSISYSNDISRVLDEHGYSKCTDGEFHHSTPVTKKSGFYSQPNPTVNVYYNKPRTHEPSRSLKIRNGNTMQPKSVSEKVLDKETNKMVNVNEKYVFDSTSCIDSITVLFIHGIINFSDFHNNICNLARTPVQDSFLQAVYHLATTNIHTTYYANRFRILRKIGELRGDNIVFPGTIDKYFITLMDNCYSISESTHCLSCDVMYDNDYSIAPRIFKITREDIQNKNLSRLFTTYTPQICEICTNTKMVSYDFKGYIALHVENENWYFHLNEIQETIIIGDTTYFLAGVIGYTPAKTDYGQTHYIAYRLQRNLEAKWKSHDNLKVQGVAGSSSIAVTLIIYIYNKD